MSRIWDDEKKNEQDQQLFLNDGGEGASREAQREAQEGLYSEQSREWKREGDVCI